VGHEDRIRGAAEPGWPGAGLLIGREFVAGSPSCLVLGDNIFYGHGLTQMLKRAARSAHRRDRVRLLGARSGALRRGRIRRAGRWSASRKSRRSRSPTTRSPACISTTAAPAISRRALKPSPRGELEITDLNRCYLDDGSLQLEKLGRGYAWLDTGTHESLIEASNFIETIEKRQGLRVCCPEEIAYFNGWIDAAQLRELARPLAKNGYGQYLLGLLEHGRVE
jgi:glucose-1-phosphate thymidylyltransferase